MRTFCYLAAALICGAAAGPDFSSELKKLRSDYNTEYQAFIKPWVEAKTNAERAKLGAFDFTKGPAAKYVDKGLALAKRAKKTPTELDSKLFAMEMCQSSGNTRRMLDIANEVVHAHPKDERLMAICSMLTWVRESEGRANKVLTAIEAVSPHRNVRAEAILAKTNHYYDFFADKGDLVTTKKLLNRILSNYADTPAAPRAKGALSQLENLRIGMKAPDFEAEDQEGVKFKLSDYRGKVVVLDFWGFW
jgi:hypothetical protein